jgi:two-component system sensor histidine kinase ChvG
MRSLRWKLLATTLAVVFIPVYFLNRHALDFFDRFTRADLEAHLRQCAGMLGEQYRESFGEAAGAATGHPEAARFGRLVAACARETGSRVRVLSREGTILFDSSSGPVAAGGSLTGLPEVREALLGAYSARARLTPDRRYMYYYIARPVKDGRRNVLAVVYIARHTDTIMRAIQRMLSNQRAATWLALGLAAAAAAALSQTLTRRLRALTRATRAFAEGSAPLTARVGVGGGDEIAVLGQAVRRMADDIAGRNAYNRQFVATTIHELRTPLTAIKGAAEILEQGAGDKPDARRKFVGNIRHEADRMIRFIGDLRELTRLDSEMLHGRKREVDYGAFLREATERLMTAFGEPHAAFRLEAPEAGLAARIVPERIEQVLANLLENAFRYTPPDGRVTVCASRGPDRAVVTGVLDTGRGIAPEHLGRVFERFFTTEPADERGESGSGLGLAIAESIVRSHGGRIWVESEPGKGANFFFSLPCS